MCCRRIDNGEQLPGFHNDGEYSEHAFEAWLRDAAITPAVVMLSPSLNSFGVWWQLKDLESVQHTYRTVIETWCMCCRPLAQTRASWMQRPGLLQLTPRLLKQR